MDRERIFELYEKLYFHELDVREKILNRLQIPLALLVSIVSFYGFMLSSLNIRMTIPHITFYALFIISVIIFIRSLYYFIRAFFNHTYELIPSAVTTENYRNKLIEHYKKYPNSEDLVSKAFTDYLYRYYSECSSVNTEINDSRSANIHNCNKFLVLNILPVFLVFLMYTLGKLSVDLNSRPIPVEISNPIVVQYQSYLESAHGDDSNGDISLTEQDQEYERQDEEQYAPATTPATTPEANSP